MISMRKMKQNIENLFLKNLAFMNIREEGLLK